MGSVNKVILVGNLGKDADFATTGSGLAVARFNLATTSRTRSAQSDRWEDRTEWHRVVLFGRQAESLKEYLRKGSLVAIDGRLQTRSWDDKDGNKRWTTEVVADRVELIGGRPGGARQASRDDYPDEGTEPARSSPAGAGGDDVDDIPF